MSGAILVDGYPVWSRGYETKDATAFRDVPQERPVLDLSCPECPNDNVLVGEKSADRAKVQRWFDCPDCGYEAPSLIVYGAERCVIENVLEQFFIRAGEGWPGSTGLVQQ